MNDTFLSITICFWYSLNIDHLVKSALFMISWRCEFYGPVGGVHLYFRMISSSLIFPRGRFKNSLFHYGCLAKSFYKMKFNFSFPFLQVTEIFGFVASTVFLSRCQESNNSRKRLEENLNCRTTAIQKKVDFFCATTIRLIDCTI